MKVFSLIAILAAIRCCWPSALFADNVAGNSGRELVSQWVKTQQLISQPKRDWLVEKDFLQSVIELNQSELEKTQKNQKELDQQSATLEEDFNKQEKQKNDLESVESEITTKIQNAEAKLVALVAGLPEPLKEKIEPLVSKLPKVGVKVPVSIRLQTLVGLMNEIEKWDSSITLDSQAYTPLKGNSLLVDVIYIGLAQGYFSNNDETKAVAGVIVPGKDGWVFKEKNNLAEKIRKIVEVYNGRSAEYTNIPIEIK